MEEYLQIITDHGFPIVASLACGYFIFLSIKFILNGVTQSVLSIKEKIEALEDRVKVMDDDMQRIDIQVSQALGLEADLSKVTRANPREIARKD